MRGATATRTAEMCHPTTASTIPRCTSRPTRRRHGPAGSAIHDSRTEPESDKSSLAVHLFHRQLRAELARGAEDAGEAVKRNQERDVQYRAGPVIHRSESAICALHEWLAARRS